MRFTVRVGIGVLLACSTLLIAQSAADQVASITSALRAGQFDTALELLKPELEKNPKNSQLWTLDGIALSGKAEKKQALIAFRRALDVSPNYIPALEGAAQIEYETGGKDAVALLERLLALHPADPTTHAMLAVLAYRRGDCKAAIQHFQKGDALLDSQSGSLVAYGDCLMQVKETEKAIGIFSRALAQSNDDVEVRCRLAAAQMMAKHPKDAIATLQPLLNGSVKDANVLELAASAYEADENTPEAVRILREAIISDPHNVNLYVDFANVSLDHQSYQVGVDMINAGLKAEPKAAPLYVARGILFVQLAQYDEAEADFEKANEIDPRQSLGSAAEGLAAVQQNDPDQALATVRAKLAKKPNDAFLLYLKAEILTQKGPDPGSAEFREAVDSAQKAVALQPSLGAAHDILAKLDLQRGNNELAAEQSRIALKTDPNDQTALYHLIQALRKSGHSNEVPELLKRLAELRSEATKEEAEHNRFKLVEDKSASSEKPQP